MDAKPPVKEWTRDDVRKWLRECRHFGYIADEFDREDFDGKALLLLTKSDLKTMNLKVGDRIRIAHSVCLLQMENKKAIEEMGYNPSLFFCSSNDSELIFQSYSHHCKFHDHRRKKEENQSNELSKQSGNGFKMADDGLTSEELQPEVWKTLISLLYLFVVTWITAFVMVVVHDRVPDMKKYPPLPDIFLDNVPTIPWAFSMCELTGTFLLIIWLFVLTFHKHRFILLRRFFALSGTVFLLRCVTMLITSLSVPGTHLQYEVYTSLALKIQRAYIIWRGAGMSIQGVRTCGDYMFSGHTVALTMLNFFITEYTPRHLYFVHTFTWILNMFGIFFILSAHEHYSIDVFIAFYISSRLFLYYHTLANNQALMQRDSNRTRIWFPLFSFFESSVHGIVPNEYESPLVPLGKLFNWMHENITQIVVITMHNTQAQIANKRTASRESKTD